MDDLITIFWTLFLKHIFTKGFQAYVLSLVSSFLGYHKLPTKENNADISLEL